MESGGDFVIKSADAFDSEKIHLFESESKTVNKDKKIYVYNRIDTSDYTKILSDDDTKYIIPMYQSSVEDRPQKLVVSVKNKVVRIYCKTFKKTKSGTVKEPSDLLVNAEAQYTIVNDDDSTTFDIITKLRQRLNSLIRNANASIKECNDPLFKEKIMFSSLKTFETEYKGQLSETKLAGFTSKIPRPHQIISFFTEEDKANYTECKDVIESGDDILRFRAVVAHVELSHILLRSDRDKYPTTMHFNTQEIHLASLPKLNVEGSLISQEDIEREYASRPPPVEYGDE